MQTQKVSLFGAIKRTILNMLNVVDAMAQATNNVAEAANTESMILRDHADFHRERHLTEMEAERREWEKELKLLVN